MELIPDEFVPQWGQSANLIKLPLGVNLSCPFCNHKVTFTLNWQSLNDTLMHVTSNCPSCRSTPVFILTEFQTKTDNLIWGKLFVNPSTRMRKPIEGISDSEKFTPQLRRAYISAINVFNAGEWAGAAVASRRLLEGIVTSLLPENKRKGTLEQQLRLLPDYQDLKAPLLTLASAIRKGGNLGAHFDLEKEPNEETSVMMLDLIEYFLEYLYFLPKNIQNLHEAIDSLNNNK